MDAMKCRHGKWLDEFCCKCEYGENSHVEYREQNDRDATVDLNMGIGYRLTVGYGMLREGEW
jgi:hypothetical protein